MSRGGLGFEFIPLLLVAEFEISDRSLSNLAFLILF
jgi:hypothetical protein